VQAAYGLKMAKCGALPSPTRMLPERLGLTSQHLLLPLITAMQVGIISGDFCRQMGGTKLKIAETYGQDHSLSDGTVGFVIQPFSGEECIF
jgi:hypothetical protein